MRLVYLGGSFIKYPDEAVKLVWEAGFIPIVPGMMGVPGLFSKELLRNSCEELIKRCDFVVMLPSWEKHEFAKWEYRLAKESGRITFLRIRELFRIEVA